MINGIGIGYQVVNFSFFLWHIIPNTTASQLAKVFLDALLPVSANYIYSIATLLGDHTKPVHLDYTGVASSCW